CRQDVPTQSVSETTAFPKSHLSPDERFGELFRDVQLAPVFPDSKTFVDCTPLHPTDEILRKYEAQKNEPDFDLSTFVKSNFELPHQYSTDFESNTSRSVAEHINALWPVLTRQPDSVTVGSLLPLPKSYIVPGGRFGEIYYWDSYFTILGLQSAGRDDMVENMADNFAHLIQTYGHIPNGNRSYYLTRSQPPYFSLIVEVLRQMKGEEVLKKYLPALEKEYAFWMDGMEQLTAEKNAHRRVVRLQNGAVLNRYWDDKANPRPEAHKEDIETAKEADRPATEVYRHLKAGAESGWDYSSRWLKDGKNLHTIHTTDIIPIDLNGLLHHLEKMLEKAYRAIGNGESATIYQQKSDFRRQAIKQFCWDEEAGFYSDYDFTNNTITKR
ncbi:MAG: trehalase family glycosidase, partial [Bacteroidota bacterium]